MKIDATELHFKTLNQMIKNSDEQTIEVHNLLGPRILAQGWNLVKLLPYMGRPEMH